MSGGYQMFKMMLILLGALAFNAFGSENSAIRDVVIPIVVTKGDITQELPIGELVASGSGVIFGPHYLMTNAHVILDGTEYRFYNMSNKNNPIQLHIVKIDREADLALMSGDFDCPCAKFSPTIPGVDTILYAVGFPLYSKYEVQILTSGMMQGTVREHYVAVVTAAPGSSGGGLFMKENGEFYWVGIVEAIGLFRDQIQPWLSFSIPNLKILIFLQGTDAAHYLS